MKPLPSRLKIALLSAGISGLVLAAFGVAMWVLIYDMRIEAVDREIRTLGSRHPGLFAGRGNYERLASSLEFTFGEDFTNHIILQLRDAVGRISYTSPHWPKVLDAGQFDLRLESRAQKGSPISSDTNATSNLPKTERSGAGRGGQGRGFGQGRRVIHGNQESSFVGDDDFVHETDIGADNGHPGGHAFNGGHGQTFLLGRGGKAIDVHCR